MVRSLSGSPVQYVSGDPHFIHFKYAIRAFTNLRFVIVKILEQCAAQLHQSGLVFLHAGEISTASFLVVVATVDESLTVGKVWKPQETGGVDAAG